MRVLVVTQVVDPDHPVLGFFDAWLRALSARAQVTVFALSHTGAAPEGVRVHALGKDAGFGRSRIAARFLRLAWLHRNDYDAVLVHMTPVYLALAGWLFRALGKRTVLWYVHPHGSLMLRAALPFTDAVATVSAATFPFCSPKVHAIGHGIDVNRFAPVPGTQPEPGTVLGVGRVAPVKRILELVEALGALAHEGVQARLTLVGPADSAYADQVRERCAALGVPLHEAGPVMATDLPPIYARHWLLANLTPTGSFDKAILEALACGVPAVVANEAFADGLLPERIARGPQGTVDALRAALTLSPQARTEEGARGRAYVRAHHSVEHVADALLQLLA